MNDPAQTVFHLESKKEKLFLWGLSGFFFLFALFASFVIDYSTTSGSPAVIDWLKDKWPICILYLFVSLFVSLLTFTLTGLVMFAQQHRVRLGNTLSRVLHLYPPSLLSPVNGDEMSIGKVLGTLLNDHKRKRGLAIDFAVESFQSIHVHGFVVLEKNENDVELYVDYLQKGVACCDGEIFASCAVRPFWFLVDQQPDPSGNAIVGYKKRGEHLRVFRDAPADTKVRLVHLCGREIGLIIADALMAVQLVPEGEKHSLSEQKQYDDLPEICWFTNGPNKSPSTEVQLYWIETNEWLTDTLGDRMVFDLEMSLMFGFVDENRGRGHTALAWKEIMDESLRTAISNFVSDIEANETNPSMNGKATYGAFADMVANLTAQSMSQVQKALDDCLPSLDEAVKNRLGLTPGMAPSAVYTRILDNINDGTLFFPDTLRIRLLDKTGNEQPLDSRWRANATSLNVGINNGTR